MKIDDRLIHNCLDLELSHNCFILGTIEPIDIDKMVLAITNQYYHNIDELYQSIINEFKNAKYNEDYDYQLEEQTYKTIKQYFFPTYNQYIKLFKPKINSFDERFIELSWYPKSEYDFDYIRAHLEPTMEYYKKTLRKAPDKLKVMINDTKSISIDYKYLEKSVYISGKAGSGKTELLKVLIMANIDNGNSSQIILDIHGDFSLEIAQMVEDTDRLIFIDLFASDDYMPSLNPFEIADRKDETLISTATQNIMSTFKSVLANEFTPVMEALIAPMVNTLLRLEGATLYDLYKFCDDSLNKPLVEFGIANGDEMTAHYLKHKFYEADNRTKKALGTRLQLLLNHKKFAQFLTGKNTFNLQQAMDNNKIIIFRFNKVKMRETLSPIGRFIISSIQTFTMLREDQEPSKRATTFCYLDEFQNFVSPDIDEVLSESRKYKLYLVLAHQFLDQITDKRLKESILTNTQLKITGMNSYAHNQAMAKQFGVKTEELESIKKVGEFYFRKNNDEAFKFQASSALLDRGIHFYELVRWEDTLQNQIDTYYQKVEKKESLFTPIPKAKPIKHYTKEKSDELLSSIDNNGEELLEY
jgi:hypothetical protein